jgi:putative transposase
MKKHFTEGQLVSILRAAEAKEVSARELCRKHGISEQTFYRWKRK